MFDKSILTLGLMVALVTAAVTPAKATSGGAFFAGGFVGAVWGAGLASQGNRARVVESAPVWDYGSPGWQRPIPLHPGEPVAIAGPGRQRVCAWQDRYDGHENYVGSRRICWIEAR